MSSFCLNTRDGLFALEGLLREQTGMPVCQLKRPDMFSVNAVAVDLTGIVCTSGRQSAFCSRTFCLQFFD